MLNPSLPFPLPTPQPLLILFFGRGKKGAQVGPAAPAAPMALDHRLWARQPGAHGPLGHLASHPHALTAVMAGCRSSRRGILPGSKQAAQTLHRCPRLFFVLSEGKGPLSGLGTKGGPCSGPNKPVSRAELTLAHPARPGAPPRAHLQQQPQEGGGWSSLFYKRPGAKYRRYIDST